MSLIPPFTDELRMRDVFVSCLATLERMKELGLVEGGLFRLGPEGEKRSAELDAAGFSPTEEEVRAVMDMLTSQAALDAASAMLSQEEKEKHD